MTDILTCGKNSYFPRSSPIHIFGLHSHSVGCAVLEVGQNKRQIFCSGDCPIAQCDLVGKSSGVHPSINIRIPIRVTNSSIIF